jgi:hypothetical protein
MKFLNTFNNNDRQIFELVRTDDGCVIVAVVALFVVFLSRKISVGTGRNFYRRENFRLPKRKKISTEEEISGYRRENLQLPKRKFSAVE